MAQDNMESQSEQEIQFKKRARRRLVGAVALVLLMIVFLPMLLEDRVAQTPKDEVVISIPSQDGQLDTAPDKVAEASQQASPQAPPQAPPVISAQSPVTAQTPEVKTPEVKPTEPPAPVAQSEKPVEVAPIQEVKPAPKEQDKPKADKPVSKSKFYVQVGVFSNPDKVKQLQAKLSENALKSSTELIDTPKGTKTRLRVGTFTSKGDAEAVLVKVKALGLTDAVVGN
jgi:DedD protein